MASALGEWLRQGGYARAVFFGSTLVYNMPTIHTDPDGLPGLDRQPAELADLNVGMVTIDTSGNFVTQSEFDGGTIPLRDFGDTYLGSSPYTTYRFYTNVRIASLLLAAGLPPSGLSGVFPLPTADETFWTFTTDGVLFGWGISH